MAISFRFVNVGVTEIIGRKTLIHQNECFRPGQGMILILYYFLNFVNECCFRYPLVPMGKMLKDLNI